MYYCKLQKNKYQLLIENKFIIVVLMLGGLRMF